MKYVSFGNDFLPEGSKFNNISEALAFGYFCEWADTDGSNAVLQVDLFFGEDRSGPSGAEILYGLRGLADDGVIALEAWNDECLGLQFRIKADFAQPSGRGVFGAAECVLAANALRERRAEYALDICT